MVSVRKLREGAVSVPRKLTIGYFRQTSRRCRPLGADEAIAGSGRVGDLHHELEALQREMSTPTRRMTWIRILERFGHVQKSTSI